MATNIDKVQQLYVAYFNRPADVAGLNFWVGALAKGVTVDTIAASFATQAEYKALFAGKGAESIINTVYLNMFGRNAEKAALDFYGPLVQNGTISIDKVVTDIVKGAQGTDATAYNNKVTAAKAFTAALDTAGNEADRIAYATGTDAVLSIAKTWLATVTTDASLTTALAAVEATVDSMGGLGNVGQTFTMTQGLDTILGTAADDTINAFAFNGTTGTNVTTLNSVDTVDGGTGVDSLFIEVKDSDATAGNASASLNGTIVGTFKNIEKITIDNTGVDSATAVAAVDASKFVGATNITQVSRAGAVTSLASSTTATFKGVDANVAVTAANGTANIALDNLGEGRTITVDGSSVTTVVLTGTVKDTSGAGGTDAPIVALTVGKDQQTATLNTAVEAVLTVAQAAGSTKPLLTVDASASSAGV
jgi:S-layer protein